MQRALYRHTAIGKDAVNLGLYRNRSRLQLLHTAAVNAVGLTVVGGKTDIVVLAVAIKVWDISRVKRVEGMLVEIVVSDIVKQVHKELVLLAIDGRKLYSDILRFLQRLAIEEKRRRIDLLHIRAFVVSHHWRQLTQVANH